MRERFFKNWAKPGPSAPGLGGRDVPEGETLDAVSGDFRLFQLARGHRFSTDDLLTAYYGTSWCPSARRCLDLGSGIGTVATVAAWRLPGSVWVTVEAQEESAALARKSAAYNGLTDRMEIRVGDFRDQTVLGPSELFDLILGSPPYFPVETGLPGDHPQKVACRFELRGEIRDYCAVAASHLTWGGWFACVFPISPQAQRRRVERAMEEAKLHIVRCRPVILREGETPLLGLFAAVRRDHLPEEFNSTWEEPALTIRTRTGAVHPEYRALKLSLGFPPTG